MDQTCNTMNNSKSHVHIIKKVITVITVMFAFCIVTHAAESNESMTINGLPIKFRMTQDGILYLNVHNLLNQEQIFISNMDGVLNLKFLGFPMTGSLQYRSPGKATSKPEIISEWYSIARHSSLAYPQDKVKELEQMREIKLPAKHTLTRQIEYDRAIVATTAFTPSVDLVYQQFRIKLIIKIKNNNKIIEEEIVSDWMPCGELIAKIQESRKVDSIRRDDS